MDCTPGAAMVFTHRVGGDSQPDEIALVISDVILKMTTDDSRTTSNHVFSFVRRFDTANSVRMRTCEPSCDRELPHVRGIEHPGGVSMRSGSCGKSRIVMAEPMRRVPCNQGRAGWWHVVCMM